MSSWPENRTWSMPLSVVWANRIASPAIAMPAAGRTRNGRAEAIGTMRRPIVKITKIPIAIAAASGSSSRSRRASGSSEVRQRHGADRDVARVDPGPRAEPGRYQRADSGGEQSGHEHQGQPRSGDSRRLDHQHGGDHRRAEQERDRGERPAGGDQLLDLGRRAAPDQADDEKAERAAHRDQRCLRAEHHPEPDRGERGAQHPGSSIGSVGAGSRPSRGRGRRSRQPDDRDRGEQPRDRQHRERPPERAWSRTRARRGGRRRSRAGAAWSSSRNRTPPPKRRRRRLTPARARSRNPRLLMIAAGSGSGGDSIIRPKLSGGSASGRFGDLVHGDLGATIAELREPGDQPADVRGAQVRVERLAIAPLFDGDEARRVDDLRVVAVVEAAVVAAGCLLDLAEQRDQDPGAGLGEGGSGR